MGLSTLSCLPPKEKTAQDIVDASIQYYGQDQWDQVAINFQFRQHNYALNRKHKSVVYVRQSKKQPVITDSLFNHKRLVRYQETQPSVLSDSLQQRYSASVNAVLYFFQLPRVLNDPAAIKERMANTTILGKTYHAVKVTFAQEGGGTDYEDEFRYWFDPETYAIDFMAYRYWTDGGGVRFRAAKNKRAMGQAIFQDYSNYKPATTDVSLDDLPALYASEQLIEVSQIENNVISVSYDQ